MYLIVAVIYISLRLRILSICVCVFDIYISMAKGLFKLFALSLQTIDTYNWNQIPKYCAE